MTEIYVTPVVGKLAAAHGVDVSAINGTGVGGRVTKADVQAVINARSPAPLPRAATTTRTPRPSEVVEVTSVWNTGVKVKVDQFGLNPLVDDARQASPHSFQMASTEATAPTLFASGDMPLYLASGADPSILLNLPWQARHTGASASAAELAGLLELCSGEGGWVTAQMEYSGEEGNRAYHYRVRNWLMGSGVARDLDGRPKDPALRAAVARLDAAGVNTYDSLYGAEEAHKAELARQKAEDAAAQAKFKQEQSDRARARQGR